MCIISGCGKLWRDDVVLEDLSCPCPEGYGYWDIFQERFVSNIRDRTFDTDGRALPMEDLEAEKKQDMSPEKFQASIRAQFIIHCLSCGIRQRIDNGAAVAAFDTRGLLRALAELLEIAEGDYTSQGRSRTFQETAFSVPLPPEPQELPQQPPQSSFPGPSVTPTRPIRNLPSTETGSRPSSGPQRGSRRAHSSSTNPVEGDD